MADTKPYNVDITAAEGPITVESLIVSRSPSGAIQGNFSTRRLTAGEHLALSVDPADRCVVTIASGDTAFAAGDIVATALTRDENAGLIAIRQGRAHLITDTGGVSGVAWKPDHEWRYISAEEVETILALRRGTAVVHPVRGSANIG